MKIGSNFNQRSTWWLRSSTHSIGQHYQTKATPSGQ